jgi:AcrR family transcriptional regulator
MLKGEGLRSINVRAVADRAGYSYATLYNYFKDIKELIFICVQGFQDEAEIIVRKETSSMPAGKERIREILKSYIRYFVQYPGIFELFFVEKMNDIGARQPTASLICTFPDRLCAEDWKYCIENSLMTETQAAILMETLRSATSGLLLLYMHRGHPVAFDRFNEEVGQQLDFILQLSAEDV